MAETRWFNVQCTRRALSIKRVLIIAENGQKKESKLGAQEVKRIVSNELYARYRASVVNSSLHKNRN